MVVTLGRETAKATGSSELGRYMALFGDAHLQSCRSECEARAEASLAESSTADYMRQAETWLHEEEARVERCLPEGARKRVGHVLCFS